MTGESACQQPGGPDFFHGSCVPTMQPVERQRFFDSCLLAQDQERLRLGRELHDSTGQLLLALRLEIARLRRVHGTPAEDELLDEIDETARQIDREIRSFAYTHYPADLGRAGLVGALDSLARGFASRTGLRVRFRSLMASDWAGGEAATALLRIAQEALVNVHRHARASQVRMSLGRKGQAIELVVRDDGVGIPGGGDPAIIGGVGLQGMRHRAEHLGGSLAVTRLRHGTRLVASIPSPATA